tara:strand:+ start:162 stop:353 length:192 start_codon:yes stop_codon:yes gene_type:complete
MKRTTATNKNCRFNKLSSFLSLSLSLSRKRERTTKPTELYYTEDIFPTNETEEKEKTNSAKVV